MGVTATDPASLLGAYVLPGRVDDPRPGIAQARAGERAGLGSIWLSDRWDTKELGAMARALSQAIVRPRIVAGATHFGTRHPLVLAGLATIRGGWFELMGLPVPPLSRDCLRLHRPDLTPAEIDARTSSLV
jgi:5,10-methylenetetrahydromethanopterin reductase